LAQVSADLRDQDFIEAIVRAARDRNGIRVDALKPLRDQLQNNTRRISQLVDMAAELKDRAPALRRIEEMEAERAALEVNLQQREDERAEAQILQQLTAPQVSKILDGLAWLPGDDRMAIRESLGQLLDRIELDPETGECQLHYRISPVIRANLASPRLSSQGPHFLRLVRRVALRAIQRRRKRRPMAVKIADG
jgi:hypothetical protein